MTRSDDRYDWMNDLRSATVLTVTGELFPQASAEFKLSITRALADQLAVALGRLQRAPLSPENLDGIQPRPGIYELYSLGRRMYVGKASKSLPSRLHNHLRKLSGRSNIRLDDVSFQCLYVDEDLEAAAPEKMLIKIYRDCGGAPWNTNGFGNKDPGRNRDHSLVKSNHFDAQYPINLDLPIGSIRSGTYPVSKYLTAVKSSLPFNLRFEKSPRSKKDYGLSTLEVPATELTVRNLIGLAIEALPDGWQATALPGYVIVYHEDATYDSADVMWQKQDKTLVEVAGAARLDAPGTIEVEKEPADDQ
jgi:Eco29kI restriction endonuclease